MTFRLGGDRLIDVKAERPRIYDAASTTAIEHKSRFVVLDGLRGVAAVAVLLFHGSGWLPRHAFSHGYLAVDFFFMLSGFVVPYAYETRLKNGRLRLPRFTVLRLIRLYPLIWLGTLVGLASFLTRHGVPKGLPETASVSTLAILSFVALPAPRGLADNPAPLNGPSWSLTCEIAVNLAYASLVRFLSTRALIFILLVALVLDLTASIYFGLGLIGVTFTPFWATAARTVYPFTFGLLIFRTYRNDYLSRVQVNPYLIAGFLTFVLAYPQTSRPLFYEFACLTFIFPLIVTAGANSQARGSTAVAAEASAAISFPLYAIHYPLVLLFAFFKERVSLNWHWTIISYLAFSALMIIVAAALAPVDARFRKWLTRRLFPGPHSLAVAPDQAIRTGP